MRDFQIRFAGPDDADAIAELIEELAEYERLAFECGADPEALRRHLSEDANPRCEALLALERGTGTAVGFALFYHSYSTFLTNFGLYLEDLFVRERYRRRGVGKKLLKMLCAIALERGCGRLEWSVLDWNRPAIDFYRSLDATFMDDWTTVRLTEASLRKIAGA